MEQWSHEIRHFIEQNIISNRFELWNVGDEPNDYIDSLIDHVKQEMEPKMDWETVRKSQMKVRNRIYYNLIFIHRPCLHLKILLVVMQRLQTL